MYNAGLFLGVLHSNIYIYIYIYIYINIYMYVYLYIYSFSGSFPLCKNFEYSSLHYATGLYLLSILCVAVCIC